MQALRRGPFIGALALGLLYIPLLRLVSSRGPAPAARPSPPAPRSRPRTPFEAALREAAQDRTRAKIAVSRELNRATEALQPAASTSDHCPCSGQWLLVQRHSCTRHVALFRGLGDLGPRGDDGYQ
jgi:hypothetical protein